MIVYYIVKTLIGLLVILSPFIIAFIVLSVWSGSITVMEYVDRVSDRLKSLKERHEEW